MSRELGFGTDGGSSAPESGAGPPRGGHPTPEELLAFHFGALEAVDRDRVEDHLSRCRECAEVVLDFAAFPELAPADEVTPELERRLEEHRRGLIRQLRERGPEGEADEGRVLPGPWPRRLRTAWAVAAVFFAATVGLSLWIVGLGRAPSVGVGPPKVASTSTERGPEDELEIPFEEPLFLVMTVNPKKLGFPEYRLDLLDEAGGRVYSEAGLQLGDQGSLAFVASRRWQPPGRYTFEIYGLGRGAPQQVGRLLVRIVARSAETHPADD